MKQMSLVMAMALLLPAASSFAKPANSELAQITKSSLRFIAAEQYRSGDDVYTPGEWPSQVYSSPLTVAFGVGNLNGDEEPTAFTTASIVNQLAMIHQRHPELSQIPPMVSRAMPALDRYREGELYNFYPAVISNGVRVHQAAAMTLTSMWKGFTNIPQDADTTSATYAARYFYQKMQGRSLQLPLAVKRSFSRYRDNGRSAHNYDAAMGLVNTGAFLTWQYDENDPRSPGSSFAEPEAGTRIPFKTNDVDCIVNLNVLRVLALTHNSDLPGRDKSCGLMAHFIIAERYAKCGIYYPNTYNFAYSAAMVDRAGETCLRPYSNRMVEFILRNQSADGGWYNIDNSEYNDRVHSTAFSIQALAQFGDPADARVRQAIQSGALFLRSQMHQSETGTYWTGEVFFTATALARSLVDWKSDAFTTAVALGALLEAERFN